MHLILCRGIHALHTVDLQLSAVTWRSINFCAYSWYMSSSHRKMVSHKAILCQATSCSTKEAQKLQAFVRKLVRPISFTDQAIGDRGDSTTDVTKFVISDILKFNPSAFCLLCTTHKQGVNNERYKGRKRSAYLPHSANWPDCIIPLLDFCGVRQMI